jgi:hypothetical protein
MPNESENVSSMQLKNSGLVDLIEKRDARIAELEKALRTALHDLETTNLLSINMDGIDMPLIHQSIPAVRMVLGLTPCVREEKKG